jgi:ABC-type transport system substrate-binding protein
MENPVVGGTEPHKVALRRAISLAVDVEKEIRLVRRGQAIPAQSPIAPETFGYDPAFKSEMSEFSRARAKALLDMHGYVDKNGDGWRDQPDGSPLLLEYATQSDQQSRQLVEQWLKNMNAIGIRIEFKIAKWPENLKSSRAGKLMMWGVGWSTTTPFWVWATAATKARPTTRASRCRPSTPCTSSKKNCPTAPSAPK